MMTLREVSPPEMAPSASSTRTLDPTKTKSARRRRLEIQKLKASSNDVVKRENETNDRHRACLTWEAHAHGVVSVMGRRREMEDTTSVHLKLLKKEAEEDGGSDIIEYDFYGVYDGHGGGHVAEACKERMHVLLGEEMKGDTWREGLGYWEKVMVRCYERMDREVCGGGKVEEMEEMTVGSTAVVALVGKGEVVVANCGDSRVVLCRRGVAMPLSFDHKPDRPDELARIEAAGGRVINWNGFRVLGVLATSRSIGDYYLKPYVLSTPEVTVIERTDEDEFLILATDGLWDVISNDIACQVVRRCLTGKIHWKSPYITNGLTHNNRAQVAAAFLTELAMAKGSKDNISVIVVELRNSR